MLAVHIRLGCDADSIQMPGTVCAWLEGGGGGVRMYNAYTLFFIHMVVVCVSHHQVRPFSHRFKGFDTVFY